MKHSLLSLLISIAVSIALTTALPAQEKCPSDDAVFCSQYKAAEQGDVSAQTNLGWAYYTGEGIDKDTREAARWYRKAAEQGNSFAQYILGLMYWSGDGVITDKRESYIWYAIAKANGRKEAAVNLRKNNWGKFLTTAEAKSARREVARRQEAIKQFIKQFIKQGKADSTQ